MAQSTADDSTPVGRRTFLLGSGLSTLGLPQLKAAGQQATSGPTAKAAPLPAVAQPPAPAKPLVPWMYMIYPLEQWLPDFQRTFDAWAEGGVRGLVVGPLVF